MRGYDPKCYSLARHFLGDQASIKLVKKLAQHIQDEIEDWLQAGRVSRRSGCAAGGGEGDGQLKRIAITIGITFAVGLSFYTEYVTVTLWPRQTFEIFLVLFAVFVICMAYSFAGALCESSSSHPVGSGKTGEETVTGGNQEEVSK